MAYYHSNIVPDVQFCIMGLLMNRVQFDSPLALRGSLRKDMILFSGFRGSFHFRLGSGYLVGIQLDPHVAIQ